MVMILVRDKIRDNIYCPTLIHMCFVVVHDIRLMASASGILDTQNMSSFFNFKVFNHSMVSMRREDNKITSAAVGAMFMI
jgi:hypothetical protein